MAGHAIGSRSGQAGCAIVRQRSPPVAGQVSTAGPCPRRPRTAARPVGHRPATRTPRPRWSPATGSSPRRPAPAAYAVQRAQASGPGAVIHRFRLGSRTLRGPGRGAALPRDDAGPVAVRRDRAGDGRAGQRPARRRRLAHRRPSRSLPGLTVTSDQGGVASGYLTARRRLGPSARRWSPSGWLTSKAGRPSTSGLFAGITPDLGRVGRATGRRHPNFPMHTLRVTGIDAAGHAEAVRLRHPDQRRQRREVRRLRPARQRAGAGQRADRQLRRGLRRLQHQRPDRADERRRP